MIEIHGRRELARVSWSAMGRDTVQEPQQTPMGQCRVAPHLRADGCAHQSLGDAVVARECARQVATPIDRVEDRAIVVAPGMALAARKIQTVMGAEQDRRGQQREADQGLQAPLAPVRVEGGEAVVVAQRVPLAVAVEARQQAQNRLIEPPGKAPGGVRSRVAPRQRREWGGGRGIERDRDTSAEARLQQGAAVVLRDLLHQLANGLIVFKGFRRQAKGEHPSVVEVQPQDRLLVALAEPVAPQPQARAHPVAEAIRTPRNGRG